MDEDLGRGKTAAVRLAEGASLRDTLAVADPGSWLSLDAAAREVAWYRPGSRPEWEHVAPLPPAVRQLDEPRLALALCHRDGRLREKALGRSGSYPGLLPLVVIRCADWVAPVRERARRGLRGVLNAETAVALAPLILLVGRRDRGAFGVDLLGDILRRTSGGRLAPLLTAADRTVRRFAYRIAVEKGFVSPRDLARTAARDGDAVLQDLCAEAALAGAASADVRGEVIATLLGARNSRARSAGVTALRRAGQPAKAERFLVDRSAVVRACARYVLRQHQTDPLPLYRTWCSARDYRGLPPGAAIGLAECGARADAALLWPLLTHPTAGVRARAVAGLRVLDVADAKRLRPLLDDPAPGVVREVTVALLPSTKQLPVAWLMERIDAGHPRHVRVAAFRLLDAHGGLVRLRAAVALLADPDVKLRGWAGQSVQRWHPSADVPHGTPEVGALLDRGAHLFSDYVLRRRKREAGLRA